MAITRISQNTVKEGLEKSTSFMAGISPVLGKYYALGTVTIGTDQPTFVEFSNIPNIYKHLKLHVVSRSTAVGSYYTNIKIRFNQDSADSSYSKHTLYANGGGAGSTGNSGDANGCYFFYTSGDSSMSGMFAAEIIDILDYANTSKNKVIRALGGWENNGNGTTDLQKSYIHLTSGMWPSTAAINHIGLYGSTLGQYSTYSLYGVK